MGKLDVFVHDKVLNDFKQLFYWISDLIDLLRDEDAYRGKRGQIAGMQRDLDYVGEVLENLEGGTSLSFDEGLALEERCGQLEEKYKDWK
eukprot:864683-Rhodomonas_salina.1